VKDQFRDKANRFIEEARERVRELAELLRQNPSGKRLVPKPVPVRVND
jgi:hypothetical protein